MSTPEERRNLADALAIEYAKKLLRGDKPPWPTHTEICNASYGVGIGAGHECLCSRHLEHPGCHGCSCGAAWGHP